MSNQKPKLRVDAVRDRVEALGFTCQVRFIHPNTFPHQGWRPLAQYGVGTPLHGRTFWTHFTSLREVDGWLRKMEAYYGADHV
jgi:hypothetical protein